MQTAEVGGTEVPKGGWARFTQDQTIYARWEANTYPVVLVNAESVPDEILVAVGSPYGLPVPERAGYTFEGWYTKASGGKKVGLMEIVTELDSHFLYARWEANAYTVTFDPGEGEVSPASMRVTYGERYGDLPWPTRADFVFTGWFPEAGGKGRRVSETDVIRFTEDQMLYAGWIGDPGETGETTGH